MTKHRWAFGIIISLLCCGCSSKKQNPEIVDQTYIHKYGVEVAPEDWAYRGENGQVITRLKNGVVVTKAFQGGLQEGESTYTFPHCDTIECKETHSSGRLNKKLKHYFSGARKEETQYKEGAERVVSWYENGSPKSIEEYEGGLLVLAEYFNPSNQIESIVKNGCGMRIIRDDYGELASSETLENGKLVLRTIYYPNGSPKEMTPYNEYGVVEGERKTFLPAGEPSTVETWVNGVQNGMTVVFQNGQKYAEVPYVKGVKKGIEKRYRNGKVVVEEISWNDDERQGPSYTYIGDTVKTDYYYHGREVTKSQYDMLMNPH